MSGPPFWVYEAIHQLLVNSSGILELTSDEVEQEIIRRTNFGEEWVHAVLVTFIQHGVVRLPQDETFLMAPDDFDEWLKSVLWPEAQSKDVRRHLYAISRRRDRRPGGMAKRPGGDWLKRPPSRRGR